MDAIARHGRKEKGDHRWFRWTPHDIMPHHDADVLPHPHRAAELRDVRCPRLYARSRPCKDDKFTQVPRLRHPPPTGIMTAAPDRRPVPSWVGNGSLVAQRVEAGMDFQRRAHQAVWTEADLPCPLPTSASSGATASSPGVQAPIPILSWPPSAPPGERINNK